MKALHILQVTNRVPWPLNDGGNIAVYNLTRYLHRAGHRMELACLNTLKHRQNPQSVNEVAAIHTVEIDTTITIRGMIASWFSSLPYNVSRFLSEDFSRLLQELIQKDRFDLVQLEGSYLSLYIPAIRAVSDVPIVLRSHNVEFQIWQRLAAAEPNILKRLYMKRLGKQIKQFELDHLQEVDAIIPIATQDESFYRQAGYDRHLRTIGSGVDLSAYKPSGPLQAHAKVGFLGSLEWMPNVQGLEWFVEYIWPQIHGNHPNAELHVAGKNPPAWMAEWQVAGMTFHGMVPDAAAFMESCHFFIVPLHAGGGMRLKVVEAMAMGRCVISTTIGAEGIDLRAGEEIILVDDAEDWVAAFELLLARPERSLAVASRAMETARAHFGLDAIGQQLEAFYQEVLA